MKGSNLSMRLYNEILDILLAANEVISSFEWEKFEFTIVIPICWLFYYLLHTFQTTDDVFVDENSISILRCIMALCISVLSAYNFWKFFFSYKPYILYDKNSDEPTTSPGLMKRSVKAYGSPFSTTNSSLLKGHLDVGVWKVEVWSPTELSVMLASHLSPLHIFIIWIMPKYLGYISLLFLSWFIRAITRRYERLQKDKSLIYSQVLNEYEERRNELSITNSSPSTPVRPATITPPSNTALQPSRLYAPSPLKKKRRA